MNTIENDMFNIQNDKLLHLLQKRQTQLHALWATILLDSGEKSFSQYFLPNHTKIVNSPQGWALNSRV